MLGDLGILGRILWKLFSFFAHVQRKSTVTFENYPVIAFSLIYITVID